MQIERVEREKVLGKVWEKHLIFSPEEVVDFRGKKEVLWEEFPQKGVVLVDADTWVEVLGRQDIPLHYSDKISLRHSRYWGKVHSSPFGDDQEEIFWAIPEGITHYAVLFPSGDSLRNPDYSLAVVWAGKFGDPEKGRVFLSQE